MIRKKIIISGKVQGVWFRASTREQALALGLIGYVSNLADGRVLVEAQGEIEAVTYLERWLLHGPKLAKVTKIEINEISPEMAGNGFSIL